MSEVGNKKRIAKNTLLLYFRMIITMIVSLYTSRIVLSILGITDYGIYNVVGGVTAMLGFLNGAMSSATQRFISFELGKNNFEKLRKVFSMSVSIHILLAVIIFILAETIGLWFINNRIVIPIERMSTTNFIYQFSIFSILLTVLSVPYNATIIAHERMNAYAYISIAEVGLKLVLVFILGWISFDKLKLYAILVFSVALIVRILYGIYCKRNFPETKYKFIWDRGLFKQVFSYSGWMLSGTIAYMLSTHGLNILINVFFGVRINAARGIADQVRGAVNSFVSNFTTAVQPQIIKTFAQGDVQEMNKLVFMSSRYSFYVLFIINLPVLLLTNVILAWWLKIVPQYSLIFVRLTLIDLFFAALFPSIASVAQASGKIKIYQITIAIGFLFVFIATYMFYKLGFPSYYAYVASICMSLTGLFVRLIVLKKQLSFPILSYFKKVLIPISLVILCSVPLPLFIMLYVEPPLIKFFSVILSSLSISLLAIWFVGIEKTERVFFKGKISHLLNKLKK